MVSAEYDVLSVDKSASSSCRCHVKSGDCGESFGIDICVGCDSFLAVFGFAERFGKRTSERFRRRVDLRVIQIPPHDQLDLENDIVLTKQPTWQDENLFIEAWLVLEAYLNRHLPSMRTDFD